MDIKPGQIYADACGQLSILAVVSPWVMVSRGPSVKPEVTTVQALRDTCKRVEVSPFIQADSRHCTPGGNL